MDVHLYKVEAAVRVVLVYTSSVFKDYANGKFQSLVKGPFERCKTACLHWRDDDKYKILVAPAVEQNRSMVVLDIMNSTCESGGSKSWQSKARVLDTQG